MPVKLGKAPSAIVKFIQHISGRDVLLFLAAIPVLILFLIAPQTFELSWAGFGQLGRGGLFFVLFFLGFDLLDFKKGRIKWNLKQNIGAALILALALTYFVGVGLSQASYSKEAVDSLTAALASGHLDLAMVWENGLTNTIYAIGRVLGASGDYSNSFLMAGDFLVDSIYIALLAILLFSVGAVRRIVTPIVFSMGMLVFYLLDAFLPYGSIGPLQFWANFIVAGVSLLAQLFGLPIYGHTNHLRIVGLHGEYNLVVYWPSVGVQSILIYSVVMVVIAAKFQAPRIRKLIYATIGIAGTIFLNVVRIFSIAFYGYEYATSGQQLDAFHNVIGEVIFPIWIVAFLAIIIQVEGRLAPVPQVRSKASGRTYRRMTIINNKGR